MTVQKILENQFHIIELLEDLHRNPPSASSSGNSHSESSSHSDSRSILSKLADIQTQLHHIEEKVGKTSEELDRVERSVRFFTVACICCRVFYSRQKRH